MRRLPPDLEILTELALDLRWTWSRAGDLVWRTLDAAAWERTRNPWFILQSVPDARLQALASDPAFRQQLAELAAHHRSPVLAPDGVAYFSMEFALGEALPLYAGGLGVLAGDYLKTASDLDLPIVGVGLLYQEGYFHQSIGVDGQQHELSAYEDPTTLPLEPLLAPSGGWLRVTVPLPGRPLWLRVWRARVGSVSLLLLDSNDLGNQPGDRGFTRSLYAGDAERRLVQEMILGIGGWRALEAAGAAPTIAHLNEGHAALAMLERAHTFRRQHALSFDEALWATRAGNVFTTHTPVAAGFDVFTPALVAQYLGDGYAAELGLTTEELLAFGRRNPRDTTEPFNLAYVAMHGCAFVNGVSRQHAAVSRRLFAPLFPRWPENELPISHVTNGVHVPSWASAAAERNGHTDEELWRLRTANRHELVRSARRRLQQQWRQRNWPELDVDAILDPNVLTLGLARRFVDYKRPTLLLHDPARLTRLLGDRARPLQIVVAGKAPPGDEHGRRLVADWLAFANAPANRARVVFLEDYDLELASELVQGVDVWLNTPLPPWEACGTSGMKVLVNGGLNLSSLDGWWAEAWTPDVGWALGQPGEHGRDDARDADELYGVLERDVIPAFYDRDDAGLPHRWLERVRASVTQLLPRFTSERMARDYQRQLYAPATAAYRTRTADDAAPARELASWGARLAQAWPTLAFGALDATRQGPFVRFSLRVRFGSVDRSAVRLELFADADADGPALHVPMHAVEQLGDETQLGATVMTSRPPTDFTPRIIPVRADVQLPMELPLIAWRS